MAALQIRRDFALPGLVLFLTLALTATLAWNLERATDRRNRETFLRLVDEAQDAILGLLDNHVVLLRAAAAFVATSASVNAREFSLFAGRMHLDTRHQGAHGLGFSARVPRQGIAAFVERRRAEGLPDFAVWPDSGADPVNAVTFMEPVWSAAALGFDMASEPQRRAAMEKAAMTGEAVATGPLDLDVRSEAERTPGIILYQPVYATSELAPAAEERKRALRGHVYSPFRMEKLFGSIVTRLHGERIAYWIADVTDAEQKPVHASPRFWELRRGTSLRERRTLSFAGRTWVADFVPAAPIEQAGARAATYSLWGLGVVVSLFLAILTWRQQQARVAALREARQRRRAEKRSRLLLHELQHRVKNMLAVVQSLANQTARRAGSLSDFTETFLARLNGLAAANALLIDPNTLGTDLRALAEASVSVLVMDKRRYRLDGPHVPLTERQAVAIGMALHELTTNATKYGSLSVEQGTVRISWRLGRAEGRSVLTVVWSEHGGPPAAPPEGSGFGTRLITANMERELNATVDLGYGEAGLTCRYEIPLDQVEGSPTGVVGSPAQHAPRDAA